MILQQNFGEVDNPTEVGEVWGKAGRGKERRLQGDDEPITASYDFIWPAPSHCFTAV
jgi:hypothetical protein